MIERVRRYDPDDAVRLEGRLRFARGQIELRHHRYDEAIESFEQALATSEADAGPDSLRVANDLHALASARLAKGDWEAAVEIFCSATTRPRSSSSSRSSDSRRRFGPDHPSIEMARSNLASVHYVQRRYEEAVALSRVGRWARAREVFTLVFRRAQDLDRPDTMRSAGVELARLEVDEGRPAAALEALSDHDEADAPRPLRSQIELVRARALHQLDQDAAARALVPRIRAGVDLLGGPASSELDGLLAQLGPQAAP